MDTQTAPPGGQTPAVNPKLRHYRKELASIPFLIAGAQVPFESLDGNRGALIVDPDKSRLISSIPNTELIQRLDDAAANRRGGIVRLTAEGYDQLKKAYPWDPAKEMAKRQAEMLRVMPKAPAPKPVQPAPGAAVAGDLSKIPGIPLSALTGVQKTPATPKSAARPTLGRASKAAAEANPPPS